MALSASKLEDSLADARKPSEIEAICASIVEKGVTGPYEDVSTFWIRLRDKVIRYDLVTNETAQLALERTMQARAG